MSLLIQDYVRQQVVDAHQGVLAATSEATAASASTLDLVGVDGYQFDITGTTPIDRIALEEGREVVLIFIGAGLTVNAGTDLLLPGGILSYETVPSTSMICHGGPSSVTNVLRIWKEGSIAQSAVADLDGGYIRNLSGGLGFRVVDPTFSQIYLYMVTDSPGLADFTLAVNLKDDNRQIRLSGDLILGSKFVTSGSDISLNASGGAADLEIGPGSNSFTGTSSGVNTGDQTITLTGDVTGSGTGSFATTIANGAVSLAKMANLAGLSVIGRSTNSSGVTAAITGTDGQVLRVSGTALGFGTIVAAGIASDAVTTAKILDANVTLAKMANLTQDNIIGRDAGAGTGVPTAIAMGTNILAFLKSPTSSNFAAAVTGETGTGNVVFSASPTFTGTAVFANATFTGTTSVVVVAGSAEPVQQVTMSGSTGGHIFDLFCASLGDGNRLFFALGQAWATNRAGYVGYKWNSGTPANSLVGIGHFGKDDIVQVHQGGGVAIGFGSTVTNPGDTNLILAGALLLNGKSTKYNNVATAGWGLVAIYAHGRSTAQTAAVASVATYTVGAADGSFEVSANVLVTSSTLHSFTVTITYTDEGNTSRTITMNFSNLAGALVTAIANAAGAVPYEGVPLHIRCKAATAITIATVGTFTTVAYNVESNIRQIA